MNKTKDKIFLYLQKLDNSIQQEYLETYSNLNILRAQKIKETQYKILLNDIRSKKMIFFVKVIDEIKENLIKLGGDKIKEYSNLTEILDSEYMSRNIIYNIAFNKNDISKYGNYLIEIINKLQAPVYIQDTKSKWETLNQNTQYDICE